jgi:hypothetical protein
MKMCTIRYLYPHTENIYIEQNDHNVRMLNIKALKHIHKYNPNAINADICNTFASHGNINVLYWLHKKGYKLDANTFAIAAQCGHLKTCKWLRRHGCPYDKRVTRLSYAAEHIEIYRWARDVGFPCDSQL